MSAGNTTASNVQSAQGACVSSHAFLDSVYAGQALNLLPADFCTDQFLAGYGASMAAGRVPEAAVVSLWQHLDAKGRGTDYGLQIGSRVNPETKGVLASWVSQCRTLGDALDVFAQNSALMSRIETYQFRMGPHGTLVVEFNVGGQGALPVSFQERALSALVAWGRHLTGQLLKPASAEFQWSNPDYRGAYEPIFGRSLKFSQPKNRLVFAAESLSWPVLGANSFLKGLVADIARDELRSLSSSDSMRSQVVRLIQTHLSNPDLSLNWVCEQLHMSRQTVYRRLKVTGDSFRTLLDDARRNRAMQLIQDESIGQAELTYVLGFREPSSCHKALIRWFGMSLNEKRRQGA